MANGASYAVTVKTQPTGVGVSAPQFCTVNSDSGNGDVTDFDIETVNVSCLDNAIGGTVSGLFGSATVPVSLYVHSAVGKLLDTLTQNVGNGTFFFQHARLTVVTCTKSESAILCRWASASW